MPCSRCHQSGHNILTCSQPASSPSSSAVKPPTRLPKKPTLAKPVELVESTPSVKPKLQTEDTGLILEQAICLVYDIPYDGMFKYDMAKAETLVPRLQNLRTHFPLCRHTGRKGARYDFTALMDDNLHLSAKSTKRGGKVAPQVIGQATPSRFCELLGLPASVSDSHQELKKYIQEHITEILPVLSSYTFDCPTVYYDEKKDTVRFIRLLREIPWSDYTFEWTREWNRWTNSSTMSLQPKKGGRRISLLEVQFHTTRKNMVLRWCYENVLLAFPSHFEIIVL